MRLSNKFFLAQMVSYAALVGFVFAGSSLGYRLTRRVRRGSRA